MRTNVIILATMAVGFATAKINAGEAPSAFMGPTVYKSNNIDLTFNGTLPCAGCLRSGNVFCANTTYT